MGEPGIFDIIGPVMVGPSSSHTAGAVRLAQLARACFNDTPQRVDIFLHEPFRHTYRGHGTDNALVSGLLGFNPGDERLLSSFDMAKAAGMQFSITVKDLEEDYQRLLHPNSVEFVFHGESASGKPRTMKVMGCSIGGGRVKITDIDGYTDLPEIITGERRVLVVFVKTDRPGVIYYISKALEKCRVNIEEMYYRSLGWRRPAVAVLQCSASLDDNCQEIFEQYRRHRIGSYLYIKPLSEEIRNDLG